MASTVRIKDLFDEEIKKGISIWTGGRDVVEYERLRPEEEDAVVRVVRLYGRFLEKIAPSIAKDWYEHESAFLKWAGVAKAKFPENKPITFPSQPGTLGVLPLFPQAIKYAATVPTSFKNNKWEIDVTEGSKAYLLGSDTAFYKACSDTGKHEFFVIMQDGLIEIGTTPSAQQFKIVSEVETKYGIYTAQPLKELEYESGKRLYRYPTLGMIPVYHDFGIKWYFLPDRSGTAHMMLLGIVIYEHDLFKDLTWIS